MAQADYLNHIQLEARNKYQLKQEEQLTKETFRRRLENFFQNTLSKQHPDLDPHAVRLKCYGSLNNGFGLTGCDMDLLLALPDGFAPKITSTIADSSRTTGPTTDPRKPVDQSDETSAPEDPTEPSQQENFEVGWLLEGALLDSGLGARLLTKTRVPILKVCESPSEELLQNLRQYRNEQMKPKSPSEPIHSASASAVPPTLDMEALKTALNDLTDQDTAAKVALPESPGQRPAASLEFEGDYGIKCDVNFSNSVAVHNTRLLREYCLYDPRVAQVGVFVKTWAKTRDINTPYYGTLSSYGYVLMTLHYLMNVVHPPVIPNLQHLAYNEDAWGHKASVDLFEGKFDIRFLADKRKIEDYRKIVAQNRDSTGNLIRGFFWYYSARDGFNWKNDIISIRTRGGILKKFSKGWTEAKWSEHSSKKNVRLRYLMAIEDPFETDHNVARVVGHHGIVAIRDEFRRAWDIISKIGTEDTAIEDLMTPMEGRGDLLRKDQDHHREKMKQMRQVLEAKERELREAAAKADGQSQENGTSSDSGFPSFPLRPVSGNSRSSKPKLTRVGAYQDKPRQSSRRVRRVRDESDGEDDVEQDVTEDCKSQDVRSPGQDSVPEADKPEEDPEPFCTAEDISSAMGFDVWGNPIAWDLSTQDGRWLQWRDNKKKDGTWSGVVRADLSALDKACPFDARRPRGTQPPTDVFPPFPLNKHGEETSCTTSHHVKKFLEKKKRRRNQKKSSQQNDVVQGVPADRPASTEGKPPNSEVRPSTSEDKLATTEDKTSASSDDHPAPGDNPLPGTSPPTHLNQPGTSGVNPAAPDPLRADSTALDQPPPESDPAEPAPVCASSPNTEPRESVPPVRAERIIKGTIFYNKWSDGGRWLQKRDALIRSGTFNTASLDPWEVQLHSQFPYRSEIPLSDLITCNLKLRDNWKFKPRVGSVNRQALGRSENTNPTTKTTEVKELISTVLTELKDFLQMRHQDPLPSPLSKATCSHTLTAISVPAKVKTTVPEFPTKSTDDSEEEMPNAAFLRSRRLAFFAQKRESESSSLNESTNTSVTTVKSLMREAGIDVLRPQLTKKDSAIGIWAASDTETEQPRTNIQKRSQPSADVLETQESSSSESNPKTADSELAEDQVGERKEGSSVVHPKVPSTRYPDTPVEDRPRDEDPQIMPIPRTYGFKFDVRQLRDLAVIKEGGNGCARDGQEFEIEDDYEWGGGGEMGYKSTSGVRQSNASNRDDVYEYGKGDEDGLLNELPGTDD